MSPSLKSGDGIFQGVIGSDMHVSYVFEPLHDIISVNSYSFMIDGSNGEIIIHKKFDDIREFYRSKGVKYTDVEDGEAFISRITEILGHEKGELTVDFARYKTYSRV